MLPCPVTALTPPHPRSWRASGLRTNAVDGHPELAVEDDPQVQRAGDLVAAAHPAWQSRGLAASVMQLPAKSCTHITDHVGCWRLPPKQRTGVARHA